MSFRSIISISLNDHSIHIIFSPCLNSEIKRCTYVYWILIHTINFYCKIDSNFCTVRVFLYSCTRARVQYHYNYNLNCTVPYINIDDAQVGTQKYTVHFLLYKCMYKLKIEVVVSREYCTSNIVYCTARVLY